MTSLQAYELTLKKIEELKNSGINVTIRPTKILDKKLINPQGVPLEKWINVHFEIRDKAQSEKIHEAANYLGMAGIIFDVGGRCDSRDWELDWSFTYTGKENEEWREAREALEETIDEMVDMCKNVKDDNGIFLN